MKKREKKPAPDVVEQMLEQGPSFTDPLGSWTGRPAEEHETPVQDADDL